MTRKLDMSGTMPKRLASDYWEPSNDKTMTVIEMPGGSSFTGIYSADGHPLYKVEKKYPIGFGHKYD